MNYEKYQKILTEGAYFKKWHPGELNSLEPDLKKYIYNKYLNKCKVFQRDNFQCQNIHCKTLENNISLHHIKFKKNGGENKPRNGVTLCFTCHRDYHAGKAITIKDELYLPSHIRGHTFKVELSVSFNWKKYKEKAHEIRKEAKQYHGLSIRWDIVALLMQWIHVPYYHMRS